MHSYQVPLATKSGSRQSSKFPCPTMKFCKNLQQVVDISDPEWAPYWTNYKMLKVSIFRASTPPFPTIVRDITIVPV
jgi:hypothetical protein